MAGNYRSRCCNVPSHPFSFGVLPEKKVTGILAVGLESQESDMYAGGIRTRDPINGRTIQYNGVAKKKQKKKKQKNKRHELG